MSPIKIQQTNMTSDRATYGSPFLGPTDHYVQIAVPLSALTNKEIDADGVLKPGVPFTRAGALVGNSPAFVYGVTPEPIKVADDNESDTIAALGTIQLGVVVEGTVIQDMMESNLARALTANEIAGFDRAGSKITLIASA